MGISSRKKSSSGDFITLEVSNDNKKLRLIFLIAFIVLAAVAFAVGVSQIGAKKPGWTEVEPSGIPESVFNEYTLYYKLGESDKSATAEYKEVARVYSNALATAYAAFDSTEEHEAGGNLATLSAHPNERVSVMPELYGALELIKKSAEDNNCIFLGPVHDVFQQLFLCTDDISALHYDPMLNDDFGNFCKDVEQYSMDREAVDIVLLGDNTVMLRVSDEYLSFADENGIREYLGLGWMKNAFIVDSVSDALIEEGFLNGVISSYDGFSRSLGTGDELNCVLFSGNKDKTVSQVAELTYNGNTKRATASIRPLPVFSIDRNRFYVYENGTVRTPYVISPVLLGRAGHETMFVTAYKDGSSCARLALDLYTTIFTYNYTELTNEPFESFLMSNLNGLDHPEYICVTDSVYYTDENADIRMLNAEEKPVLLK